MAGNPSNTQDSDAAITLLRNVLSGRRRSTIIVQIDLDPVPGWGNKPEDHAALIQRLLNDAVPHYNPTVQVSI